MSDWQVGDLVVRVEADNENGFPGAPPVGLFVTVDGVYTSSSGAIGLRFDDYPSDPRPWVGWLASFFRKVRPDEQEACEPEFVTLLKRSKQSVSA